jgi:hypothetical protein
MKGNHPQGYDFAIGIRIVKVRKGVSVLDHQLEKRFGVTAVKMGFITAGQLHEAMRVQIDEDLHELEHRLIGRILLERGYISSGQVRKVLRQMGLPARFCPEKGDINMSSPTAGRSKEHARPLKTLMH